MTLSEFGQWVKEKVKDKDHLPDELVALMFLRDYPQYADMVGSGAEAIQQAQQRKGWFKLVRSQYSAEDWAARAGEANSILATQLAFEASIKGVDIPTLMQIKLMEKEHQLKVDMLKAEAAHALEVHGILETINASLKRTLIPKAEQEVIRPLETRIKTDNGRGQPAAPELSGHELDGSEAPGLPGRRDPSDDERRRPGKSHSHSRRTRRREVEVP